MPRPRSPSAKYHPLLCKQHSIGNTAEWHRRNKKHGQFRRTRRARCKKMLRLVSWDLLPAVVVVAWLQRFIKRQNVNDNRDQHYHRA